MEYTKISEDEALRLYDEMLDEIYPTYKIGSSEFTASEVLKELDETAYRCGFIDWLDSEQLQVTD